VQCDGGADTDELALPFRSTAMYGVPVGCDGWNGCMHLNEPYPGALWAA
jgi:hypothetical protein